MTTAEKLKRQRDLRKQNGNLWTSRYEKTPKGFLMRKYRNMQSRVSGVQKLKSHLYGGLSILPRNDFYKWSNRSKTFWILFLRWVHSNYNRKLCPSVDRLDSSKGYEISNMEWVTHSVNSSRGARKKLVAPDGKVYTG